MIHGFTGWLHVVSAIVAMALGAYVVLTRKGTPAHKRAGYAYAVSMLLVNVSAFMIYRLFGKFGPFHIAAVVSLTSLTFGMGAAILRRPAKGWLDTHEKSMSWSVIGLYAAFVSETGVRFFPVKHFWPVVMAATFLVMAVGAYFLYRKPGERRLTEN